MIEKPIARWTLGPVSNLGHEILLESLKQFTSVYPEFDRVVCYNNIDQFTVEKFAPYAKLYEQKEDELPCQVLQHDPKKDYACGCGWKLSPSRLRINAHELFLDNDLVIFARIPEIDQWIASRRHGLISEGKWGLFGAFSEFIQPNYKLCAGLFGLPPFFNFNKHIKYFFNYFKQPLDAYDEQGMTSAIVSNMKKFYIVPIQKLRIIENHDFTPDIAKEQIAGIHFVGANRRFSHYAWQGYKKGIFSKPIF
jgi:hypothetical protein